MGVVGVGGPDLALPSLWHQGRWRGGQREPGLVACAVQPGTLDLVMAGQRRVAVPAVDDGRVLGDVTLETTHTAS